MREYLESNLAIIRDGDGNNDDNDEDEAREKIWYADYEYDEIEALNEIVVERIILAMEKEKIGNGCHDKRSEPKNNDNNSNSDSDNNLSIFLFLSVLSSQVSPQIEQELGDSTRGLEYFVPEIHDRRKDRRVNAHSAVFREQERQQNHNICSPRAISRAYRRFTVASRNEASVSGLRDERFIRDEFGPLEPTGIKLRLNNPFIGGPLEPTGIKY